MQEATQKLFDKNSGRGLEGKPPLSYSECLEVIRSVAISNGYSEVGLFQGCPYSGSRKTGTGGSAKDIADLKTQMNSVTKEMSSMKNQRPGPQGNNRRGRFNNRRGGNNNNSFNYNNNGNQSGGNRSDGLSAKQSVALSKKLMSTCQTYNLTGYINLKCIRFV